MVLTSLIAMRTIQSYYTLLYKKHSKPCFFKLPRKEVIQPQVLLRLPCYDLAPITIHTLGARLPYGLAKATLGTNSFHGLTGGVYKVRERIHRVVADTRLLAISTS